MMKKKYSALLVISLMAIFSNLVFAEDVHWTYSGNMGPEYWSKLDPAFSACSAGKNQSPIDITGVIDGELPKLSVSYKSGGNEILNNGHTIQVNYQAGSTLTVDGKDLELKQFHFHSPSENTIEGNSYPMEAHFVHLDKDRNIAVIAIMFQQGKENISLRDAWAIMPTNTGEKKALKKNIDANTLLPNEKDYFRFNGSLTTPPCSEGVRWLLMKSANTASKEQLEKFSQTLHHPNNRPIQAINARIIIQ